LFAVCFKKKRKTQKVSLPQTNLKEWKVIGIDPGIDCIATACINPNERPIFYSRGEYNSVFLKKWDEKVKRFIFSFIIVLFGRE